MLEETKDTITVPASFMFRVFSTINNIRRGKYCLELTVYF